MRSPPDVFHLKQEDRLLGVVHINGVWDMFWFQVCFEPFEAFAEIAPLFDKALHVLDGKVPGDVNEIWDEIITRGVRLVRSDDNTVIDCFMLYIDGDQSRLRYVEPSELEEPDRKSD